MCHNGIYCTLVCFSTMGKDREYVTMVTHCKDKQVKYFCLIKSIIQIMCKNVKLQFCFMQRDDLEELPGLWFTSNIYSNKKKFCKIHFGIVTVRQVQECISGSKNPLIEGFYMMSYQANFASHHTHNHHVGFLFEQSNIHDIEKKQNIPELFILFFSQ